MIIIDKLATDYDNRSKDNNKHVRKRNMGRSYYHVNMSITSPHPPPHYTPALGPCSHLKKTSITQVHNKLVKNTGNRVRERRAMNT